MTSWAVLVVGLEVAQVPPDTAEVSPAVASLEAASPAVDREHPSILMQKQRSK